MIFKIKRESGISFIEYPINIPNYPERDHLTIEYNWNVNDGQPLIALNMLASTSFDNYKKDYQLTNYNGLQINFKEQTILIKDLQ